jgi:glycosyltransferase involved in cell wall biosynthesis
MAKLSVTIITHNEEANIARCLDAARWADETIVVDAESADRTVEIARPLADKVLVKPWEGFGVQKNFAAAQAANDWILNLDADEFVTPELAGEIQAVIAGGRKETAFYIARRNQFCGRYLKHGGCYPDFQLRLFRRDAGQFNDRLLHERFVTTGTIGYLKNDLLHWTFPTLDVFYGKFERVTRLGAEHLWAQGRRARLSHFIGRPLWKFFKSYFLQQGFRDGMPGFLYASLSAIHVFVRYAKLWEIEHNPNLQTTKKKAVAMSEVAK